MTQQERVLKHLKEKGTITSLEAFNEYGITRLGAVIYDLREEGQDISTIMINVTNRFGETARVAKYAINNVDDM